MRKYQFRIPVTILLILTIILQFTIFLRMKPKFYLPKPKPKPKPVPIGFPKNGQNLDEEVSVMNHSDTSTLPQTYSSNYFSNRHFYKRGSYTVLTNYIQGSRYFDYMNSVTYVTHATIGFLDNIQHLVEFWTGPISIAIYSPGPDFLLALDQIVFLYTCTGVSSRKIQERVSFHFFFDNRYLPHLPNFQNLNDFKFLKSDVKNNCSSSFPTYPNVSNFRLQKKLMYPINMARNIARENSQTYYVLQSDIELLPNPSDLIQRFLDLVKRRRKTVGHHGKKVQSNLEREVFVLPPFELSGKLSMTQIPRSKLALQKLLKQKPPVIFPFHFYACPVCHEIPHLQEWIKNKSKSRKKLNIFHTGPYITTAAWEPFYIGTHFDPPFDERIFRENALNKPIQAAALCHAKYKFNILDNAFLVHKPGLKYGKTFSNYQHKINAFKIIQRDILPLQFVLYGQLKDQCWQVKSKVKI